MSNSSKKDIEVVTGEGSNLAISNVEEHITELKPKAKEENKKKIVIPESKKSKSKKN